MAIDLDAIRRKLAKLNGVQTSKVQLWKPGVGEHRIRVVPWPDATPEEPFKDLFFYYLGNEMPILAPFQFGKPDPINDLIKSLYASKTPEDKELAKKLRPNSRTYIPIVDRADEKAGVQLWAFGKQAYTRLLGFFLDEDTTEWMSTDENGFDLKVQMLPPKPGMSKNAKTSLGTIDTAKKPSKLSNDPEVVKKWLSSTPNLADLYPLKSAQEIQVILERYLNGGMDEKEDVTRNNPTWTEDPVNTLKNEVTELSAQQSEEDEEEKQPVKKHAVKKQTSSKQQSEEDDSSSKLDAAFDSILNDD